MPVVLEYLAKLTHPASPEVSATISWTSGQLLGGIFIIIMDALKAGDAGEPPNNMKKALIFQAVIACIIVPLPLLVGIEKLGLASGKITDDVLTREHE